MGQGTPIKDLSLSGPVINFVAILLGLAAAYFHVMQTLTAIYSQHIESLDSKIW